jgi:hypothetical protein
MTHSVQALIAVVLLAIGLAARDSGPRLIPLLWTQGQDEKAIRKVLQEVREGGNTGFVWESRPHPDYLGPRWWADLGVALEEAEKLGLEVWIFDEWMYPSGIAGGKVAQINPELSLHVIEARSLVPGDAPQNQRWIIPKPLGQGEKLLSVTALPEPPRPGASPVPLPVQTEIGWRPPSGGWRLVWVLSRVQPPKPGWSMSDMIDVMNPAATAAFIQLTHEPTYRHFQRHFGKTLKGFFSDETGFRNITSYSSLPGTPGMPLPWSPVFAEYFKKAKGYDITPLLAGLWYDAGPPTRGTRFDFVDVCSRALAENFFRPQQEWCRRHGVRLIGHLVEDNHADHNLGYGPGHWFRSTRYFDMPGIDVVGYQVTPGIDTGFRKWPRNARNEGWDQEFFQFAVPAMARGAALLQGTREIMSEAFGAYGWVHGLRMQKWLGDWHIVNGIAILSPHAYTMKFNDPDHPPHFNQSSGNPQWRYYSTWAKAFRREQEAVLESGPQFDALVVYTAESRWVGPAQTAAPVVRALELRQLSTLVAPYERLAEALKASGVGTAVLPEVKYVPREGMEQLAAFAEAGGRVLVVGRWPEGSADGRADEAVAAAAARLRKSPRAALVSLGELPARFGPGRLTLTPANRSVAASIRRRSNGEQWVVLQNRSLEDTVQGVLEISGPARHAALLDAPSGRLIALRSARGKAALSADIEMPPYSLWCIRLSDRPLAATRPLPKPEREETLQLEWAMARATDDRAEAFEPLPGGLNPGDWRSWPGMKEYAGTVRFQASWQVQDAAGPVWLDAGRVEEIAELFLNGQPLGVRIHPPYRWNATGHLKAGRNEIVLLVANTAAVRWKDPFSYGDPASGLFGPVRLLRGPAAPPPPSARPERRVAERRFGNGGRQETVRGELP